MLCHIPMMVVCKRMLHVTRFAKRDHNPHLKCIYVLQGSIFPLCYGQSKSNMGVLYRCCCSNNLEISPRTAPSGSYRAEFTAFLIAVSVFEMVLRIPGMEGASVFLFGMI